MRFSEAQAGLHEPHHFPDDAGGNADFDPVWHFKEHWVTPK